MPYGYLEEDGNFRIFWVSHSESADRDFSRVPSLPMQVGTTGVQNYVQYLNDHENDLPPAAEKKEFLPPEKPEPKPLPKPERK